MVKQRKGRVLKAALIILVVLLVCTVASRTVYSLMLPGVSSGSVNSGYLETVNRFYGIYQNAGDGEGQWVVLSVNEDGIDDLVMIKSTTCEVMQAGSTRVHEVTVLLERYELDLETGRFRVIYNARSNEELKVDMPAILTVAQPNFNSQWVPVGSVFQNSAGQYVVYGLHQRQGTWGLEYYVQEYVVAPGRADHLSIIVEFAEETPPEKVAVNPSRPLADGEVVDLQTG